MQGETTVEMLERFWSKVDIGATDKCWEWMSYKNVLGYGRFHTAGKHHLAHRLSWKFTYGDIPGGMCVCHHCDNPSCVNPRHLFLGTPKDNRRDAIRKGRVPSRGEKNNRSKLTENDVREIRKRLAQGELSQRDIGNEFGVSNQTVSNIKLGKNWNWEMIAKGGK